MNENKEYKGIAKPFLTRYVIMEFNPSDLRYPVSMATKQEFETVAAAQHYIDVMNWNCPSKMIVPIVREVEV